MENKIRGKKRRKLKQKRGERRNVTDYRVRGDERGGGNTNGNGLKEEPERILGKMVIKRKSNFPTDCTKLVLNRTTHITIIKQINNQY